MRRLAAAAGVAGAGGLAAGLVWWQAGAEPEPPPRPAVLAGRGLAVELPPGWRGRILPGPVLRAGTEGARVVLRDVSAAFAPLGPSAALPPGVGPGSFRLGGRYFLLATTAGSARRRAEVDALLASLSVRPRPAPPLRAATAPMPAFARRSCRVSRLLRPVCPRGVPPDAYPPAGTVVGPVGGPGSRYDVLEVNGRARRLVLLASRYGLGRGPLAGWVALGEPAGLAEGLRARARTGPVLLGQVRWGGRAGVLVLAGGVEGPLAGHLVLRWREPGRDYALALRAGEPLRESVAALRAVAASMPPPRSPPRSPRRSRARPRRCPGWR